MINQLSQLAQFANMARSEADQIMSTEVQIKGWEHAQSLASSEEDVQQPQPFDDRERRYAIVQYYIQEMRTALDSLEAEIPAPSE
jgi:hypothetical protein